MRRKPIRKVSDKMAKQLKLERELTRTLFISQNGLCADCGSKLGWRSAKHELKSRAQGGSPVDIKNCVLLCGKCHDLCHGIIDK